MPPLPKRKISRARRGERRRHLHLLLPTLVACPQCHIMKPAHIVCPNCGTYKGRQVIKLRARSTNKEQ
ncbi:MAG: 50S ribosomal protein L32 [Chloroflexota bacterium]|nr:50S ribosomal protein L32 [Chloroflexota bacterium]